MSWCPSGVQCSAALSADYNYRRYGTLPCPTPGRGPSSVAPGVWLGAGFRVAVVRMGSLLLPLLWALLVGEGWHLGVAVL